MKLNEEFDYNRFSETEELRCKSTKLIEENENFQFVLT